MEATVREGQAPAVVVSLQPGEQLTSEAGAMMFVSGDIAMEVEMPGGLAGGLKRKLLAGESIFVTRYRANGGGAVGLTGPFPARSASTSSTARSSARSTPTSAISARSRSRAPSRRSSAWGSAAAARGSSCSG
jgi:Mitochondrial biogenesis AIM24